MHTNQGWTIRNNQKGGGSENFSGAQALQEFFFPQISELMKRIKLMQDFNSVIKYLEIHLFIIII